MPDAVVHGVDRVYHQTDCHLVLFVQAIQEKGFGRNFRRMAFLYIVGKQITYKWTTQYVFYAIFLIFQLTQQTNATEPALVPRPTKM